jgi:transposase
MPDRVITKELRWKIIGLLADKSNSNIKIAKLLKVSEKCVRTTKKNYLQYGLVRISPPGRPEKLTDRDKNYIHRQVRINPHLRELTSNLNSKFKNIDVSKDTVRSILTKKGIGSYKTQRKPMLTIKDRVKRWKWCRQRFHWQIEDWAKVLFSNESSFTVFN